MDVALFEQVCQIHIVKANARNHTSDSSRHPQSVDKPQSWAQVAKNAVGVMKTVDSPFAAQTWHQPAQTQSSQQPWAASQWHNSNWKDTQWNDNWHNGWHDSSNQWGTQFRELPTQHEQDDDMDHSNWLCIADLTGAADLMGENLLDMDPHAGYGKAPRFHMETPRPS
eukprot:1807530-Amphidinium_carterae.1